MFTALHIIADNIFPCSNVSSPKFCMSVIVHTILTNQKGVWIKLHFAFLRKKHIVAGRPDVSNSYKDYHMTTIVPRQREWTFRLLTQISEVGTDSPGLPKAEARAEIPILVN